MNTAIRTSLILAVAVLVAACGSSTDGPPPTQPPLTIDENGEIHRLTLSALAASRLGIETTAVRDEQVGGQPRKIVPYAAVLYDAHGGTWVYANPEELVYVRAPIAVERVDDGTAILSDGPAAGTLVVIVGGSELWGGEHGVGGGH